MSHLLFVNGLSSRSFLWVFKSQWQCPYTQYWGISPDWRRTWKEKTFILLLILQLQLFSLKMSLGTVHSPYAYTWTGLILTCPHLNPWQSTFHLHVCLGYKLCQLCFCFICLPQVQVVFKSYRIIKSHALQWKESSLTAISQFPISVCIYLYLCPKNRLGDSIIASLSQHPKHTIHSKPPCFLLL